MKKLSGLILLMLAGCPKATIYIRDERSGQQWYYDDDRDQGTPDPDGILLHSASQAARSYYRGLLAQSEIDEIEAIRIGVNTACTSSGAPMLNASGGAEDNRLYASFCDNSASLDMLGHELMHGFIDTVSGTNTYPYEGETGAIEEGIADLFGELLECAHGGPCDWLMGTGLRALDRACSLGCAAPDYCCDPSNGCPADYQLCNSGIYADANAPQPFRNLADPGVDGRPSYYQGPSWWTILPPCSASNDNCGVHHNSGLFNRVSYLLVKGGTQAGITVAPAPSFPRAVLALIRTGSSFVILAGSFDALALSLPAYADPADALAITDAFCAVGLPSTDNDCRDLDGDGIVSRADNCKQSYNIDQLDTDHDGAGDPCDHDIDNDGRPNADDACPADYDPVPTDGDGDGLPDACDPDRDGDQLADTEDNCPRHANADQADLDLDGVGDACDRDRDGDCVADTLDHCPMDVSPCGNRAALCEPCDASLRRIAETIVAYVGRCVRRDALACATSGCAGGGTLGRILAALDAAGLSTPELGGRPIFVRYADGSYRLDPSVLGPPVGGPRACSDLEAELRAMEGKLSAVLRACTAARDVALEACNPKLCRKRW